MAGSHGGLVIMIWQLIAQPQLGALTDPVISVSLLTMATPLVAGVLLLLFSRPIAALVTAGIAADSPPPEPLTVRGFTQIGVFLLGLFTLLRSLPLILGSIVSRVDVPADLWITAALGVGLMLLPVSFGKLVDLLRR